MYLMDFPMSVVSYSAEKSGGPDDVDEREDVGA